MKPSEYDCVLAEPLDKGWMAHDNMTDEQNEEWRNAAELALTEKLDERYTNAAVFVLEPHEWGEFINSHNYKRVKTIHEHCGQGSPLDQIYFDAADAANTAVSDVWEADDWFVGEPPEGLTAKTTDDELWAIAVREAESALREQYVDIGHTVYDWCRSYREELRNDERPRTWLEFMTGV